MRTPHPGPDRAPSRPRWRGRHAVGLLAAVAPLLAVPAGAAHAHGAPTLPLSRTAACGPEGGTASRTAACRAARAAGPDPSFADWAALRVPDVNGRDREVIRDGTLCSGGLPAFRGLDLPRADWPTTTLTAGATITFRYRATIEHQGEFRLFVTRSPYDPARSLRWADLQDRPFLQVTDPPLVDGAYRLRVTLPEGLRGRHLIYTVWQNAGPDTYYSCSDVVFRAPAAEPAAAGRTSADPRPAAGRASTAPRPAAGRASTAPARGRGTPGGPTPPARPTPAGRDAPDGPAAQAVGDRIAPASDPAAAPAWELPAVAVGVLAVAAAAGTAVLRRRRPGDRAGRHGG